MNNTDSTPNPETISIPLTKGHTAIVDIADCDLLDFKWQAIPSKYCVYARRSRPRSPGRSRIEYLHRAILSRMLGRELGPKEVVDHINGNGLDNRRNNLRLATHQQKLANRRKTAKNSSGYKGVCWNKSRSKWQASISVNDVTIHLGRFDNPIDAHGAYIEAAQKYYKEFANSGESEGG